MGSGAKGAGSRLPPGFGIALSGGAVRGAAHIGVLEVLVEAGIPLTAVAGTSAGSLVGALFAAGMTPADMRRLALATRWTDLFMLSLPRGGVLSGEGLVRFMEKHLPAKHFSALPLPFAAVATNLQTGEKVELTAGRVSRAVQASCSLPVVFTPTRIRQQVLIDGGLVSQVPVHTLREVLGASPTIAVNVNSGANDPVRADSVFRVATQVVGLVARSNALREEKLADVVIGVNARGISLYDVKRIGELIERGREAASRRLPDLRRLLG